MARSPALTPEPAFEGLVSVGSAVLGDLVDLGDIDGEFEEHAVGSSVYSDRQ